MTTLNRECVCLATDDHRTAMRLQSAMEHIQLLTREKNMLLESSNKMREELMEMKKEGG